MATHSAERKPPRTEHHRANESTEVARIQDQLKRAMYGEAWHGPALMELLRETPVDLAPAKPLEHAHSIWELVLHIMAWHDAGARRLGGELIELSAKEDFPDVDDVDEPAWRETLRDLEKSYENLQSALSKLADSDLEKTAPGREHSVYVLAHGIVQHTLYHAGQIAVLKKSSR